MRPHHHKHRFPAPMGPAHMERARQRRGGGRGGLARFFAHGDLRLVILDLIREKPRHGYDIIKAIEEAVGGAYSPSPGVIYPTLTLLEDMGYVSVEADGARKSYAITTEGEAFLTANAETLEALRERMSAATHKGGPRSPAIFRAMQNLKTALRLKLSTGDLSDEQIEAIAAELDATALKIEKS